MIYLITGTPGGGKSLRAVWYAEQFLREGRAVFGNINGYSRQSPIPGMTPLVKLKSGKWEGGIGGDWSKTPDGSVVIYDEAQRDFPQRGASAPVPELIRKMETHRHSGHDLLIVTQHPNQVDHWLRRLVGKHDHVRRLGGMSRVALTTADSVMELPVGVESSSGEKSFWKYPASLYDAYESATFHTVKHRIPQPVIFMLSAMVVGLLIAVYAYLHYSGSGKGSSPVESGSSVLGATELATKPEPSLSTHQLLAIQPVHLRPVLPLSEYVQELKTSRSVLGCAQSANDCKCWDATTGDVIAMSARVCVAVMNQTLPVRLSSKRSSSS